MRAFALVLAAGLALAVPCTATAQEIVTIERQLKGQAGRDIRIGVYVNLGQDCRPGPLPIIRLETAPANGKVTVKRGKLRVNNHADCLAAEVPGYAAFYRSKPDFSGVDEIMLEITQEGRKPILQKIKIQIEAAGAQNI